MMVYDTTAWTGRTRTPPDPRMWPQIDIRIPPLFAVRLGWAMIVDAYGISLDVWFKRVETGYVPWHFGWSHYFVTREQIEDWAR